MYEDTIERHGHSCSRDRVAASRGMFACLLPCILRAALEEPWAAEKRRQATRDAIRYLEVAGVTVVEVRFLGAFLRAPCAKSAASALIAIGDVAQRCDRAAFGAVKAAERAVRDVVVLRCRSRAGPWDQSAFIANAAEAFGRPFCSPSVDLCAEDRELRAVLTLAFLKLRREARG